MAKPSKEKTAVPRAGAKTRKSRAKKTSRRTVPTRPDVPQASADVAAPILPPATPEALVAGPDVLDRLWVIIDGRKDASPGTSHSARLLARGTPQVAQKLGEEAVECLIEVMAGNRAGAIAESADLLYHLLVTWVHVGIRPQEVWEELQRRERASQLLEDMGGGVKQMFERLQVRTTKIP